mgnify:CR=1 FL=1
MKRNETRTIKVGNLTIGGNNEVIIQSMTNTKLKTLKQLVKQINSSSCNWLSISATCSFK